MSSLVGLRKGTIMPSPGQARIQSILVDKLFGFLSYDIKAKSEEDLIVLYGDNGSGKTTILNLLFHALSPEDAMGHRTFIARIPLKRFKITFAGGHCVSIIRRKELSGPFTMRVEKNGQTIASHDFTVTGDDAVRDQKGSTYRPLVKALEGLRLGLFLLPDSRKIQSNLHEDRKGLWHFYVGERMIPFEKKKPGTIDTFTQEALQRATHWARRHALAAASQGETDTNKIYAEILRRISSPSRRGKPPKRLTFPEILKKVEILQQRSLAFGRFGLVTPLIGDLLPIIENASPQRKGVITQVLSPFIRSFEARLNALEELRDSLETFSEIFSRFYNYKTLNFDVGTGITISMQHNSAEIDPEVLSSGEKQLLLLFCNVLLARSRPSVFIIDEPELSLNIKWQRELISSLLSCVKGCDVQFLFATHSLEMISLHKRSAVKLVSLN